MAKTLKVVLVGRSEQALRPMADALAGLRDLACTTHLVSNGRPDTLTNLEPLPDVLVLRFDSDSLSELAALADSSPDGRPPMIVVGPAGDSEAVRLAVRSGARDFLPEPMRPEDLAASVERLREALSHASGASRRADIVVVLGAAGGVGTSTVA
jgi:pilus assembly protein CpaE